MIAHINNNNKEESVLEHNLNVAQYAQQLAASIGMEKIAYITGYVHDMGKLTSSFEEYLRNAVQGKITGKGPTHSTMGGKYIYEKYSNTGKLEKLVATIIAWSAFSHHGIDDMVTVDAKFKFKNRLENITENNYDEAKANFELVNKENIDELFEESKCEIKEIIKKIDPRNDKNLLNDLESYIRNQMAGFYVGMLARLNLSLLIEADRTKTAEFMSGIKRDNFIIPDWSILISMMDKRLKELSEIGHSNKSNNLEILLAREEYSRLCYEAAGKDTGIYQLDMPTGGGKTLASMNFALNHAKLKGKERIFYIAPYKSILTQNANEYKGLFKDESIILEHHSDVIIEDDNENNISKYFTENWRNGLILTTMVQFLNTLFGGKTQQIRRFQALTNSIIIIDEVQSIPTECIHMFNAAMNFLKLFNTTIVLCTATQPVLQKAKIPISLDGNLIEDNNLRKYFKRNEVVDLRREIKNCEGIGEFARKLIDTSRSGIVIVNTKKAALEIYNYLKKNLDKDVLIIHLSTNMCPCHQKDSIQAFKKILEEDLNRKVICVSTPILEAGVDISAQWIIRSLTGWDSIMQAAGRCNRHGRDIDAHVYVVECSEERVDSMPDIRVGRECSKTALRAYGKNTDEFGNDLASNRFIRFYFERFLHERKECMNYSIEGNNNLFDLLSLNEAASNEVRHILKTIDIGKLTQAFKKAGDEFEPINTNMQGVIVPYHDGKEIISELASVTQYDNPAKLLKKAQPYTVNLFANKFKEYKELDEIYKLDNLDIYCLREGFYSDDTGIDKESLLEDLIF